MLGRNYDRGDDSTARTLELVGERWSLLILRDAMFAGSVRFTDFQRTLGIATNVLTTRLNGFVAAGIMRVGGRAGVREYLLTEKGGELQAVVVTLAEWGDRWAAPDGPPVVYEHDHCGGPVHHDLTCADCGTTPPATEIGTRPGPG